MCITDVQGRLLTDIFPLRKEIKIVLLLQEGPAFEREGRT
jgi:hypothetical protein